MTYYNINAFILFIKIKVIFTVKPKIINLHEYNKMIFIYCILSELLLLFFSLLEKNVDSDYMMVNRVNNIYLFFLTYFIIVIKITYTQLKK